MGAAAFFGAAALVAATGAGAVLAAAGFFTPAANLTRPEGPFGRTKTLSSVPLVMARLMWLLKVVSEAFLAEGYLAKRCFLMVGRETPARSGLETMASLIISTEEWVVDGGSEDGQKTCRWSAMMIEMMVSV